MTTSPIVERVTALVAPICADLGLELYDLEFGGGQLTITLDKASAPAGEASPTVVHDAEDVDEAGEPTSQQRPDGITLDSLALATRLISRELDHSDPIPGHYTLEVSSPGLERALRTPSHFQRAVGTEVAVRLRDVTNLDRRVNGVLSAADDTSITVTLPDGDTRTVAYDQIDRARTVFTWGPPPKPARGGRGSRPGKGAPKSGQSKPSSASAKPSRPTPTAATAPHEKAEAPS